jgi:hypothetical protein
MHEFADLIDGLADTVATLHGVTIRYAPADGSDPIVIDRVTATAGGGGVELTEGVLSVDYTSRDFLIKVDDLARGSTIIEPDKSDVITEIDPDTGATLGTYTVMQPTTAHSPWKWMDTTRRVRRVHTKETAVGS